MGVSSCVKVDSTCSFNFSLGMLFLSKIDKQSRNWSYRLDYTLMCGRGGAHFERPFVCSVFLISRWLAPLKYHSLSPPPLSLLLCVMTAESKCASEMKFLYFYIKSKQDVSLLREAEKEMETSRGTTHGKGVGEDRSCGQKWQQEPRFVEDFRQRECLRRLKN